MKELRFTLRYLSHLFVATNRWRGSRLLLWPGGFRPTSFGNLFLGQRILKLSFQINNGHALFHTSNYFNSSDSLNRDGQVHVIDENGKSMGIVSLVEAKLQASSRELQLYLLKPVSHQSPHALYKLVSRKDMFEIKKKKKEQMHNFYKNQQKIKEQSLSTDIGEQDRDWKIEKIKEFLAEKNKVKLIINKKFRSKNSCREFLDEILNKLKDDGELEGNVAEQERRIKCVLKPIGKTHSNS